MNVNTLNDSNNTVATTNPFSGLDNVAIVEVTQIQDVFDDRRIVMTLTESLSKGYAEGHVVGEMNSMTIDTVDLDYAITSGKYLSEESVHRVYGKHCSYRHSNFY